MGHFAMTCSASGLGISGGTPVRCLLLTASPYVGDDPRKTWIVRTPPIRAEYNDYGSIKNIHPNDEGIAQLWTRGFREDVVEKGLGDNSCHDVPVPRNMSFEQMLAAIQEGRLEVRQDAKRFWMRPLAGEDDQPRYTTLRQRVERILEEHWPGGVSKGADEDKFYIDEPVPYLARVRWGAYQSGQARLDMLRSAHAAIEGRSLGDMGMGGAKEPTGLVGMVTAGTGRYAEDVNLLVHAAPATEGQHVTGAQWDMGPGQDADQNKTLRVGLAMIREDVWQALIAYPYSDYVSIPCVNCGQSPAYHKDGACPTESINRMPYKEHPKGTTYAHGPVFSDDVPHVFQQRWSEYVWYGIEAFKAVTRSTWKTVLAHLSRRHGTPAKEYAESINVDILDDLERRIEEAHRKDEERLDAMSPEDRAAEEAKRAEARARWEAEERRKKENPFFGDFLIGDLDVGDCQRPGVWVFRDSTPGVIGISEHMSMLVADKIEATSTLLDALAELSAVNRALGGVGVVLRPAASTGPQDPEWRENVRFLRTVLGVAERVVAGRTDDGLEGETAFATFAEAAAALSNGALVHVASSKPKRAVRKLKKPPVRRKTVKKARAKTGRR